MADKRPYVVVIWLDAWKGSTDDVTPKTAGDHHHPATQETRGWLVKQDSEGVQICNERCLDDDDDENRSYRGPTFVPAGMIKEIFEVTVNRKRIPKRKAAKVAGETDNAELPMGA